MINMLMSLEVQDSAEFYLKDAATGESSFGTVPMEAGMVSLFNDSALHGMCHSLFHNYKYQYTSTRSMQSCNTV